MQVREGATTDLGGGGGEQRTSNIQLMSVTPEVSQLSGWLKAVADWRGSQAGHTVRGAGCGPQEAERGERLRCACSMQARGRDYRFGRRGDGEQRTENIKAMFVTREVSQPEMSALKLRLLSKRALMSVTPETHQPAMGPYFAVAAVAFETYSVTAVFRLALLVKVWPVQAGGVSDGDGERDGGLGGGGLGEGSGSEGEGGGGGGGEQRFATHLSRLFSHCLHLFLAAPTPLARSIEIRSIMRAVGLECGRLHGRWGPTCRLARARRKSLPLALKGSQRRSEARY